MSIRVLKRDDAESYRELRLFGLQESATAFGSSYEEEIVRTLHTTASRLVDPNAPDSFVLGDFENDKLSGVVGMVGNERMKTAHIGIIWGMYVRPAMRGQGRGRALMQAAIARSRNIDRILQLKLSVVTSNEAAKQLYESLGFEVYGVEPRSLLVDGVYYDQAHLWLRLDA